jgi:hypothetical protein
MTKSEVEATLATTLHTFKYRQTLHSTDVMSLQSGRFKYRLSHSKYLFLFQSLGNKSVEVSTTIWK